MKDEGFAAQLQGLQALVSDRHDATHVLLYPRAAVWIWVLQGTVHRTAQLFESRLLVGSRHTPACCVHV